MLTALVCIIIFALTSLVVLEWSSHRYWAIRSVQTPPYLPILGHFHLILKDRWKNIDQMYREFKSAGYWGIYELLKPVMYISKPTLIRDVAVKDFDYFVDRRPFNTDKSDVYVQEMLFTVKGQEWKNLRSLLTPTFTSGKMKNMFPLILSKTDVFVAECETVMKEKSFIDANSMSMFYTLDALATCAFGIDANCIQNREKSDFVRNVQSIFEMNFFNSVKLTLLQVVPWLFNYVEFGNGSKKYEPLNKMIDKTIELRKETGIRRNDFLDSLLDLIRENDKSKYPMTLSSLKAQTFAFLFTGFDTTGGTLGLILYCLAKHPQKQSKLREEMKAILESDGEFTYHNVMEAPYLDACINESLRLYPAAAFVDRQCVKDYSNEEHGLRIAKDTILAIPLWSIHYDPDHWTDPGAFEPERFSPENKHNIKPYTYMPFGVGPRNCIANRFATMVVKILTAKMCLRFKMRLRPGFELALTSVFDSVRPDDKGVQICLEDAR